MFKILLRPYWNVIWPLASIFFLIKLIVTYQRGLNHVIKRNLKSCYHWPILCRHDCDFNCLLQARIGILPSWYLNLDRLELKILKVELHHTQLIKAYMIELIWVIFSFKILNEILQTIFISKQNVFLTLFIKIYYPQLILVLKFLFSAFNKLQLFVHW